MPPEQPQTTPEKSVKPVPPFPPTTFHRIRPTNPRALDEMIAKRTVMSPGEYTELFFLDEATALAAGHRPCAYCSRTRYAAFIAAWQAGNPGLLPSGKWSATHLDECLQHERVDESGHKRLFEASADTLPDGTFTVMPGSAERRAALLLGDKLLPWSPEAYLHPEIRPGGVSVSVVTPRSTVRALSAGYKPAGL